ncbi:nucleoid-structuring protein H-NS [Fulvivirga sp. RKSG066]|uniref:nucleoid-structuring protein H-NS n=1 Tax=Fulvivirga aurantia TaxID=2529383 RepID=UPI0012BC5B8E|nr:nucleoid-structuring protein H-NS [Fulvivirga aurantia]MTI21279.1 nucleoid-structuring protein H-NS [Fulvivirga aurantia]
MKTKTNKNLTLILTLMLAIIIGGVSCKSKKKLTDVSDPDENKMENVEETDSMDEDEEEEGDEVAIEEPTKKEKVETKLSDYFSAIANAPSVASANRSIEEALNLFDSPDALVLIVIANTNGKKDYDRPTTIKEYLNYLKDQKKNINRIGTFKLNASNEITELELIKK